MPEDQVFCLRGDNNSQEWFCVVAGKFFGPWPDKGATMAGLATEQRRTRFSAKKN